MAKYRFEMSWNYSEEEYEQFLQDYKLTHLKSHKEKYFKVGDALRSEKGVIARIVGEFNNYENLSHDYTIANNKLDGEQMDVHFGRYHHPVNQEGLRYVSSEVGYVDQDEEYL